MAVQDSTITIHMVCSLDGYIAKPNGDVSWMETSDIYEAGKELGESDIADFLSKIDCYVMGSKTYEHALELGWPYGEKPVFVLSGRNLDPANKKVQIHSGSLQELVAERLRPNYRNIWMAGGSKLTRSFLQENLADELVITFFPILLGTGIPFFDRIDTTISLHLKDVTAFKNGMVEMTYRLKE